MAEGVLFDLAGKVLELLGYLTLQEIKLACGVKAELEKLKSKVSTIQAVLLDAQKQASKVIWFFHAFSQHVNECMPSKFLKCMLSNIHILFYLFK